MILLIIIFALFIQLIYILVFFLRLIFFLKKNKNSELRLARIPLSVIICAKNAGHHLAQFLPKIIEQNYFNDFGEIEFEIIVVDDYSNDDTEKVLSQLCNQHKHVHFYRMSENSKYSGKKAALALGVEKAKFEHIVVTDADCFPASKNWLNEIAAPFDNQKQIVLGYGAYESQNDILNKLIQWETIHTSLQYGAFAIAGKPYMAVGRNLAFTKVIFHQCMSHEIWNKLPYGDDDGLIQIAATKENTTIVFSKEASTISVPPIDFTNWVRQKQRHLSTGKLYKKSNQFLLMLYALTHAASWLGVIYFIFFNHNPLFASLLTIRCILFWFCLYQMNQKLNNQKLFVWIPLCDFGWLLYNIFFSQYIFWKSKQTWQ